MAGEASSVYVPPGRVAKPVAAPVQRVAAAAPAPIRVAKAATPQLGATQEQLAETTVTPPETVEGEAASVPPSRWQSQQQQH